MSDIPLADVVWIGGANVAECAPITTSYIWQARENGAKIINVDPRITPLARTCDLELPIKPGRAAALYAGILHLMIKFNKAVDPPGDAEQGWRILQDVAKGLGRERGFAFDRPRR